MHQDRDATPQETAVNALKRATSAGLAAALSITLAGSAIANEEKIAEFSASGFLFKDSVEVQAFEDPDIEGVTIYISDFKRSLTDKLFSDPFTEPTQASVTCSVTGPVRFKSLEKVRGSEGREVFSERKSLLFFNNKTQRVRRIFDEPRNTLLYVAYSTRVNTGDAPSTGRYRTSLCALPLPRAAITPAVEPVAAPAATVSVAPDAAVLVAAE